MNELRYAKQSDRIGMRDAGKRSVIALAADRWRVVAAGFVASTPERAMRDYRIDVVFKRARE
ncbi:hypothetical protein [Burkholderia pyrrocinia]|uniref:hypothetical protein n=1 Tax=Burkholderia pyrrocinia TaxID=60550 RepID=UPI00158B623D|nr:hypothetical protein [Burkholderia pyrrocinia]